MILIQNTSLELQIKIIYIQFFLARSLRIFFLQLEHEAHGSTTENMQCITMRRYCEMALTNLTFGDGANKALLCSFTSFMEALVAQLASPSEDLRQITAAVIRNLSWYKSCQTILIISFHNFYAGVRMLQAKQFYGKLVP